MSKIKVVLYYDPFDLKISKHISFLKENKRNRLVRKLTTEIYSKETMLEKLMSGEFLYAGIDNSDEVYGYQKESFSEEKVNVIFSSAEDIEEIVPVFEVDKYSVMIIIAATPSKKRNAINFIDKHKNFSPSCLYDLTRLLIEIEEIEFIGMRWPQVSLFYADEKTVLNETIYKRFKEDN